MSFETAHTILKGMIIADAIAFSSKSADRADYNTHKSLDPITLSATMHTTLDIIQNLPDLSEDQIVSRADNLLIACLLGYIYQHNEVQLREIITRQAFSANQIASTLASAYMLKLALDHKPPENYFPEIWAFCSGISDNFDMSIRKIGHVLGWGSELYAMRHLGKGETPDEIVTLALYCILRYPNDFLLAVQLACKTEKNNEQIASITGIFMATKLGLDGLPITCQTALKNRNYILKLAKDLLTIRGNYVE